MSPNRTRTDDHRPGAEIPAAAETTGATEPLAAAERGAVGRAGTERVGGVRGRWGFLATAYTLLVLIIGTNLPTPLYRGYQAAFGFSALTVTLIFAAYVAVLIPSLLVLGPLSDAIGRRRVLLPAVGVAALASLVFALAQGTGWLYAARMLQGLAVGAATGALTAALTELEPRGDRRRAALVSTVLSVGGIGLGPLVGGLLAQYLPAPRVLPFVVEIVLLVPAAMAALPEAGHPAGSPARTAWRPRRPQLPAAVRPAFATSGMATLLAFAVVGLFLTLVPTYVTTLSHSGNLLLAGAAVALMLACSAVAQLAGYGRPARGLSITGLPLLAAGLVLLAVAGSVSSLALLLVATGIAGAGQGLVFLGGLSAVNHAAPPRRRADVVSSFYVVAYLGVGVPVIGVGFLATSLGLLVAVRYFAAAVAALCLFVLIVLTVRGHRAGR
ncbi:MFS transporter [Rugosimonospora acidiphila]|uniref:MFS transporter n=1 Tax=Rugosimonospora acidiphila TaxID=556531 RepID=A0ABP9RUX8_9ACTN